MLGQQKSKQTGVGLIEALVALLILSFGLLGLAGVQMRAMAETRTAVSRGLAIRLTDDLNERMQVNRQGVLSARYNLAWGTTPAAVDCGAIACTAAQQAQSDLATWKRNVAAQLQGGNAMVFQTPADPRQVGVMLAWRANEGKANSTSNLSDASYTAPFTVTGTSAAATCPANSICHLVYLQPWGP